MYIYTCTCSQEEEKGMAALLCGSLEILDYMVEMCVLAPSLTPRGGILVRMVSCGMVEWQEW